jgi:hypothetical protein
MAAVTSRQRILTVVVVLALMLSAGFYAIGR